MNPTPSVDGRSDIGVGSSSAVVADIPKPRIPTWDELLELAKEQAPKDPSLQTKQLLEIYCCTVISNYPSPVIQEIFRVMVEETPQNIADCIESYYQRETSLAATLKTTNMELDAHNTLLMTPMLATVLKGSTAGFKVLWNLGLRPVKDAQGFSELHWAAMLLRTNILDHVVKVGKRKPWLKKYANIYGATPKDIVFFSLRPKDISICLDGRSLQTTQKSFQESWRKAFAPYAIYNFDALYHMRLIGDQKALNVMKNPVEKHLVTQLEVDFPYNSTPPTRVVNLVTDDEDIPVPDDLKEQFQLVANKQISKGELICLYGGEGRHLDGSDTTTHVDFSIMEAYFPSIVCCSSEASNEGPYANDSFPNCAHRPILWRGLPQRALFALDDIPEGTPITFLYSSDWFLQNKIPHTELRPAAFKAFIANTEGLTKMSPLFVAEGHKVDYHLKPGECSISASKIGDDEDPTLVQIDAYRNQHALAYIFANENWKYAVQESFVPPQTLLSWLEVMHKEKIANLFSLDPTRLATIRSALQTKISS